MGLRGVVDLTLGYVDERDGQGSVFVFVNDTEVGQVLLDADTDRPGEATMESIALETGDEIRIIGYSDDGERARIDYVELTADPDMFLI